MEMDFEAKLKRFILDNGVLAEHMHFDQSCQSVDEAAKAANAARDSFVKNVCMIDENGNVLVCIVKGEDRVSKAHVSRLLQIEKPRMMNAGEVLEKTGYPAGGTPSFGYKASFLVDERVMEKDFVLSGGGSENSLVRISPKELLNANSGLVAKIRE